MPNLWMSTLPGSAEPCVRHFEICHRLLYLLKHLLNLAGCITQHQKDQALSNRACCATSCPGPCNFLAGLLQCSSGWTSIKHNQTSTNDDSECSGTTGLQWTKKSPCYTSLYLLSLATGCSSHQVQNIDAYI